MDMFGLVAFFRNRNGDPRWPDFQGKVDSGVNHGLRYNYTCTTEATIAKFTIHWVEYEDESQLQSHFETLREAGQFPSGLRTDGFLYVDDACIQSVDSVRPFICYWEPHTSRQPLKRDMPTDKERTWPYKTTSELANLHKAASNEPGGIWPTNPLYEHNATQ
ncbi:hypothetical protein K4F52_008016 [Lecanicillium sp. MT-2017a]|nr:hypothetical protein K4F52_008016 [Lecanicillium sp. MT-2017a]